jgi:hypothetical protein
MRLLSSFSLRKARDSVWPKQTVTHTGDVLANSWAVVQQSLCVPVRRQLHLHCASLVDPLDDVHAIPEGRLAAHDFSGRVSPPLDTPSRLSQAESQLQLRSRTWAGPTGWTTEEHRGRVPQAGPPEEHRVM